MRDVDVVPNPREFSEAREERGVDLEHRLVEAAEPRSRVGDGARERVLDVRPGLPEEEAVAGGEILEQGNRIFGRPRFPQVLL